MNLPVLSAGHLGHQLRMTYSFVWLAGLAATIVGGCAGKSLDFNSHRGGAGGSSGGAGGSTSAGGAMALGGDVGVVSGSGSALGGSSGVGGVVSRNEGGTSTTGGVLSQNEGGSSGVGGVVSRNEGGVSTAGGGLSATGGGLSATGGVPSGTGGVLTAAGSPGAGAGGVLSASGGGSGGDRLVLDSSTLKFFNIPINSIRYAVSGYDAAARTCATVIWDYSNTGHYLGAHCRDFSHYFPYFVITPDTDGPCEQWAYGSDVQSTAWNGCVDFALADGGVNLVDSVFDVVGTAFTGQIVVSNRASIVPAAVTFGLTYASAASASVYVQMSEDSGHPTWLTVTQDGKDVNLFDRCDVALCGQSSSTCGRAAHRVLDITRATNAGVVYVTWDGQVRSIDSARNCLVKEPAAPGAYQAQVCYGTSTTEVAAGTDVADVKCVTRDFTYPSNEVTVAIDTP